MLTQNPWNPSSVLAEEVCRGVENSPSPRDIWFIVIKTFCPSWAGFQHSQLLQAVAAGQSWHFAAPDLGALGIFSLGLKFLT